jgi:uncharacterized protein involved in exopolysaccharide biosynthesis
MRSPQLAEDVTADPAVVSLTRLARVILQRRRLLFALLLTGIGVTLALALLQKRTYTATSSFMPQSRRVPNNLSGLAAQFGVALPNEGSVPPAFYADLLDSRAILAPLATDTFTVEIDGRPRQSHLVDLFHVKARTPALEREGVLLKLQDAVESSAASP